MNIIYAEYNIHHNSIDIATTTGYLLRIACWEAEKGLKTTACSECALNILAIDEPLEYARLYLEGNMQMWVDTEVYLKFFSGQNNLPIQKHHGKYLVYHLLKW